MTSPPIPAPWRCVVYETRTGLVVDELPLVGVPQFNRLIGEAGSVSITTTAAGIPVADLRQYLTGWRHSLAAIWGGAVLQAGPIVAHQDPDDGSGTVTIGAVGLGQIFNRRVLKTAGVTTGLAAAAPMTISGVALPTVIKYLLLAGTLDPYCELPIVLPATDIPGTESRTYLSVDLRYIGQEVSDLSGLDNGPEVDFSPRLTVDSVGREKVEHVVRIGNPTLDVVGGEPWTWDYGQSLLSLPTSSDSSRMGFRAWARGNVSQGLTPIGYAEDPTLPAAGWPQLDIVATASDETDQAVLNALATGQVTLLGRPVATWEATVLTDPGGSDAWPSLAAIIPGGWGVFGVYGHRTVPDGDYRWRVLGYTNADVDRVKLIVADQPDPTGV
ncbi:hypothetical protein JOF41_007383 [Saccharothrix coeruleofusca]|uniref:hypothetical protein n=1 Tax=Saccharothrix coeruleofusca TaxID=33919 RepID=UPI001AE244E7|nr:hypothetical protein [Saccharothrix coeruleofusca]MBP2341129.1 hypothetical protein [Saccharothrix coeruleofusca]